MDGSRRHQGPHPTDRQAEAILQPGHQDQPVLLQSGCDFSPVSPGKPAQMTILAGHLQGFQRLQEAELPLRHGSCKPWGRGHLHGFWQSHHQLEKPRGKDQSPSQKTTTGEPAPSAPESTPRALTPTTRNTRTPGQPTRSRRNSADGREPRPEDRGVHEDEGSY